MALQLAALAVVSLVAILTKNSVFWLVAAGMAVFTGFYWYDTFVTNLGLAFGLMFLVYGLNCFAIAFIHLFIRFRELLARDDN